ncbi:UNVERIFIED_ORG: hypothetical protein M2348_000702 [Sphingomonas sp. R1F5B]
MSNTRTIILADREFAVPPLPIRINRLVYPIVRELSAVPTDEAADCFLRRLANSQGSIDAVTDAEWSQLIELAFLAATAADQAMTREQFDTLPITPPELLAAFFPVRLQTGAWVAGDDVQPIAAAGGMVDAAPADADQSEPLAA